MPFNGSLLPLFVQSTNKTFRNSTLASYTVSITNKAFYDNFTNSYNSFIVCSAPPTERYDTLTTVQLQKIKALLWKSTSWFFKMLSYIHLKITHQIFGFPFECRQGAEQIHKRDSKMSV